MTARRKLRRLVGGVVIAAAIAAAATIVALERGSGPPAAGARTEACVATNSIPALNAFSHLVRRPINCAVVYANATMTWAQWAKPWFLAYRKWPRYDWIDWYRARRRTGRLIVTQPLIPTQAGSTWLQVGAAGSFEAYARELAGNLVAAGLGGVTIRLGHEANGTWEADSIGTTAAQDAMWVKFWRNTVLAMRSVPGAHFQFDWCVNAGYRPIPLQSFYPGDDVVDTIGVDTYDASTFKGGTRIETILTQTDGLRQVAAFARAHHKPMSIPEWGIGPTTDSGVGDDPAFVNAIARVVDGGNVAYQSYFYSEQWGAEIGQAPRSVAAYIRNFGH